RRLCRPRHAGGACYRALHARFRIRPETQSRVGLLRQELVEQAIEGGGALEVDRVPRLGNANEARIGDAGRKAAVSGGMTPSSCPTRQSTGIGSPLRAAGVVVRSATSCPRIAGRSRWSFSAPICWYT